MDENRELGRAETKAFRLLTLRAHSEKELRTKLRVGGYTADVIEAVVRRCQELGYLNDEIFARQRARALAVNRLAGDQRIAFDLKEKGIDPEGIAQAIAQVRKEFSEEEAVGRLLKKKIRERTVTSLKENEKAALARSLMGKGFPTSLILKMLKKTGEEGFHDDDGE